MGSVNFNAIQPGLLDPFRRVSKLVNHPHNVVSGRRTLLGPLPASEPCHLHELVHGDGAHIGLIVGKRNRRNELFTLLHRVDAGRLSVVTDLDDHFRAVTMHRIG
ncbi:unannotated protein [freshwater metagenome]|uniref:Unannotated protein n=1 Tax=freshwater metagenome TaxID=449393 RepID=A0A6J7HT94_9ZZZZ